MEQDHNPVNLDHLVAFYEPHESHSGPILKPRPQRDIYTHLIAIYNILFLLKSNPNSQHSKAICCWGIRRRRKRKALKSRSEEKVLGFSSASLFPISIWKWEAVTQGGTRGIDYLMWKKTWGASIIKAGRTGDTTDTF